MNKNKLYISTVCENAVSLAEEHGLGIEIAEFCTAYNMDTYFTQSDETVREQMLHSDRFVFHAPFNELCPAAIDPLVLDITEKRFLQALELSLSYGIKKLVIHSGYTPLIYYKSWFHDRSVEFWKRFMDKVPDGVMLCLENVMEDSPEQLCNIVREVNDPRFKLCLDIGHSNTMISNIDPVIWAETCVPLLEHVHIHNNVGQMDLHSPLGEGTIDMKRVLNILSRAENATYTIESLDAKTSIEWLVQNGFIEA